MKKSILVFLFVSSITSSFYYSLKRTDGDIIKSIMFAMYVLAIKLNLVGPAIIASFEPNPPPPAEIRVLVGYTASDDYYTRPPRVYMGENKARTIAQQYPCSASAITLRAGSRYDDIKETAYLLVAYGMH